MNSSQYTSSQFAAKTELNSNRLRTTLTTLLSLAFASSIVFSSTICTADNPNHKPEGMGDAFAVRDKDFCESLKEEALKLYLSANKDIETYKKTLADRGPERLSNKSLGNTYAELNKLERVAQQLAIRGETAGADFLLRHRFMKGDLKNLIVKYYSAPSSSRVIESLMNVANKQAAARTKEAQRIEKLFTDGDVERAEERMNRALDLIYDQFCVLRPLALNKVYQPFGKVHGAITEAMKQKRTREAIESATEQYNKEKPDFSAMLSEIKTAISSVGASGTATWGDATVTGPELVGEISTYWKLAQTKTLRCRTIGWVIGQSRSGQEYTGQGGMSSPSAPKSPLEVEFEKFSKLIVQSISELVSADTARVSEAEAEKLYVAYVEALAPVQRLSFSDIEKQIGKSLYQLASKSSALKSSVDSYDLATSELLRWRKRVASAIAADKMASFPSISEENFKAAISKTGYSGLYPLKDAIVTDARLLDIPTQVIPPIVQQMMGKNVTFEDAVLWSSKDTSPLISRYQNRVYGSIPSVGREIRDKQVNALKTDLMVSDQLGPLSLQAALAIESLKRSDMRTVGGTVEGIFLESVVTRFGALPEAIGTIVPYGNLPREPAGVDHSHVIVRYAIVPKWVQFEYAFVDLEKETGPAETGS